MNPILASKAKEIIKSYLDFELPVEGVSKFEDDMLNESFDEWAATPSAAALLSGEDWISVKDREPKEIDGQILVTNGNGFYEIVWRSDDDGMYNKPHRFDENDWAVFRRGTFTHWQHLPEPPKP